MQAIARSASRTARASGESDDLLQASHLPGKLWHLFELANSVEPSPIFAISHDFEAMPFQLTDTVDLGGRSGIDIEHLFSPKLHMFIRSGAQCPPLNIDNERRDRSRLDPPAQSSSVSRTVARSSRSDQSGGDPAVVSATVAAPTMGGRAHGIS
jgi:hypothetical protein